MHIERKSLVYESENVFLTVLRERQYNSMTSAKIMNVELRRYLFAHPSTLIFVECARFMCVIFVIKYLIHSIELAIRNCNALCNSLSSLSHVRDFNPHTASDASICPVFFVPPFRILNVFC